MKFMQPLRNGPFTQPAKATASRDLALASSRESEQFLPETHGELSQQHPTMARRELLLGTVTAAAFGIAPGSPLAPQQALAAETKSVVVVGATGQTGRRVLERLATKGGLTVTGGVRDVAKADKTLNE